MITAWHFSGHTLRDGSPIPKVGKPLVYTGEVVICRSGLHASRDPYDALNYAPGPILHRVECSDIVKEQGDKFVCRRRTILQSIDATEGLRYFARTQALSVVHLWNAPDVVLDYLMTGDEHLRAAAWDATRDAAWSATRDAARDAAWSAAWSAAKDAAWDAARDEFNQLVKEAFS